LVLDPVHLEEINPQAVLDFWFSDRTRLLWFEKSAAFDAEIRDRFGPTIDVAIAGGFEAWRDDRNGALALLILLDQMTRNIFRGDPRSFAGDARALIVAGKAVASGLERDFPFSARRFFYLPYEHSEDPADQERSLVLFTELAAKVPAEERDDAGEQLQAAQRHHEIIRLFGRFPHRNAVLGRISTPEEISFLAGPNSSF
jgi:uncharacterized protein (DUF924 family)